MNRTQAIEAIWEVHHTAPVTIKDTLVRGMGTNITCQSFASGLTIDNVVSVDSWRADQFGGQGLYMDQIAGNVLIQDSYFGYCGRPRTAKPAATPTPFKHGLYANSDIGKLTVTGCIFAQCANAGLQSRTLAGTIVTGCVFLDCSNALLLIEGGATLLDNVVYGGQYNFDGSGLTGNTALRSYWPVLCKGNYFLTRPNQDKQLPPLPAHPLAKPFPQGGINLGGEWVHTDPVWTPPPAALKAAGMTAGSSGNCISRDWPGGTYVGDTVLDGFALCDPGKSIDYAAILLEIESGMDVAAAIAELRKDLIPVTAGK